MHLFFIAISDESVWNSLTVLVVELTYLCQRARKSWNDLRTSTPDMLLLISNISAYKNVPGKLFCCRLWNRPIIQIVSGYSLYLKACEVLDLSFSLQIWNFGVFIAILMSTNEIFKSVQDSSFQRRLCETYCRQTSKDYSRMASTPQNSTVSLQYNVCSIKQI